MSGFFKQLLRIVVVKCHHPGKDSEPCFCGHLRKPLRLVMGEKRGKAALSSSLSWGQE